MRYACGFLGRGFIGGFNSKPDSRLVFTLIGLVALLLHGQSESSFVLPVARYTPSYQKK